VTRSIRWPVTHDPISLDRRALKDECKEASGSHSTNESHYAEEDDAKVAGGEELVVEEENGDFDDAET
jgi:hypothetical protein